MPLADVPLASLRKRIADQADTRHDAPMEGFTPSIVGREDEQRRLVAAIEADRSIAVVGEAGIGKTSIIRAAAQASRRRLFEGGGFATLRDEPLLALRRATATSLTGDPADVAGEVERRVGPDLLFVDDLQWVDAASVRVLALLRDRITLLVAIRAGDPGTRAALALAGALGLESLALHGLDDAAARAVVHAARPTLANREVERIVARAGGNPLVLEEIATRGAASLVLTKAISAGLADLTPSARDLLELLAIADRPIARERLGATLVELALTGFVIERGGQVSIRHALIAEAIASQLDATRLSALHVRSADLADGPAEAARHLVAAGRSAQGTALAGSALAATDDPVIRAELLVIVADASGAAAGLTPRLAAAAALTDLSDWDGVMGVLERDDDVGSPDERVSRDAFLAHAAFSLGRHDAARGYLDRAGSITVPPDSPAAAHRAIERAAFMVNVDGQLEQAIADLTAALADHPVEQSEYHAIRAIVESLRMLAEAPVDIAYLAAASDGALGAGKYASAADLARVVTFAMFFRRGAEPALAWADGAADRLAAAGSRAGSIECRAETVQASILAGRPADALTRADELLERPAPPRARQTVTIFRARALGLLGLLEDAERTLDELEPVVSDDYLGRGELLLARADLAMWGGQPDRAIGLAERVLRVPSPTRVAYALPQLTRAWAQLDAGLAPEPIHDAFATPAQAGVERESEALVRLHAGDPAGAAERFWAAAERWADFNVPRELVCRWADGESRRRAGDTGEAVAHLEAALARADDLGLEVVAVRIRRSLRQAGRRPTTPAAIRRATAVGLTRRERELLDHVGRGLTNAEIARRMGLGRPTVARILSNAMAKLGAETRGQAVRLVAERR